MIDRLSVLLDQEDRAGNLAGRDFVPEELADLLELLPVEMGAGRNIEGALRARQRRSQQQQRAACERAQHPMTVHQPLPGSMGAECSGRLSRHKCCRRPPARWRGAARYRWKSLVEAIAICAARSAGKR